MESFVPGSKRASADGGTVGSKRSKQELESIPNGTGRNSKPCTKFFSIAGCPFGEGCHFLHYVPGGITAVARVTNFNNPSLPYASGNPGVPSAISGGLSQPATKTRICNKYNTAEGCKFGDKCHFAHGELELGKPVIPAHEDRRLAAMMGRLPGQLEPPPPGLAAAASFGASAAAKISVDASLAGAIIGKGGMNSKHIRHVTGAKLSIQEHDTDPKLRNIALEGTFDQIKHASAMVHELLANVGSTAGR